LTCTHGPRISLGEGEANLPWFVARTTPGAEQDAAARAQAQGASCYLPRYRKIIVEHGRRSFRELNLFPGYLFIEATDQWHYLVAGRMVLRDEIIYDWKTKTFHKRIRVAQDLAAVQSLILDGEQPALVPDHEIDYLRSKHDDEGFIVMDGVGTAKFVPGQRVRAIKGPFQDHIGVFAEMTSQGRDVVLLKLLGRDVKVKIAEEDLVPA
jgi:transcription antitermination factor NusG